MIKFVLPDNLCIYDYEKIRNEARIVRGQQAPKPRTLLGLYRKENGNNIFVPVCTAGNLSAIQGKAKSRKTFFICVLNTLILQNQKLNIVIFDTEQGEYHATLSRHRIDVQTDIDIEYFRLRKYTKDINLDFINDHIIKTRPDFVFIDNIRDCMHDINSNTETSSILKVLKQVTDEIGTHVCVTLHENPYKDNDKARGVIGTELQNACEVIFKVEKNIDTPKTTDVKGTFTRNGDFDDLEFEINEYGLPELTDKKNSENIM
jgi:hypothetical protein